MRRFAAMLAGPISAQQTWSLRVGIAAMDARNFARFAVESHERMVRK